MKTSFTYLSFVALLVGANALKDLVKLPIVDIVDGHFTPGGLDDPDVNGLLEKRACGGCSPYLCDGHCCQFNKCCKKECCQPAANGCTKAGRCIIQC